MISLPQSHLAADMDNLESIFLAEITSIDHHQLPLQKALEHSSYVSDDAIKPVILNIDRSDQHLVIRAGIFYQGIIAGCQCADDPGPLETQNEYCQLEFSIDKKSGEVQVFLLD